MPREEKRFTCPLIDAQTFSINSNILSLTNIEEFYIMNYIQIGP
jgi:hypothetical protein